MKILYCQEEKITLSTKMNKAVMEKDKQAFIITDKRNETQIRLDNIREVCFFHFHGIGSMIKFVNASDGKPYFLTVPRIYINIGGGFAIINAIAVKRLYNKLKQEIEK